MNCKTYIIILLLIAGTTLSSCRIGKAYKTPEMDIPEQFDGTENMEQGVAADIGWSTLYTDTVLQKLIAQALEYNKDMLAATARIKEMIANKRIKFAGIFPEIGIRANAQKEYLNYGGHDKSYDPEFSGALTFSWEADIWGKLRWQNEAGIAAYMQSVEAQRALQLTIVSQVAQMYFELKALDQELYIVKHTLEARREGVRFAKLRYDGGLTSEIPYRQSLVELARTETLVPGLENEIKLKENDLSVFLGEFPTDIPRGTDITHVPIMESLPVDLPSSLLERRPDVRQAEQKLREANANVGIALTNMFPQIRLTGNIGGENSDLANFLKSPAWFVAGTLTGPLFNLGKNRAAHKASQAAYEQQVYQYEKKILEVFREVDNAIETFQKTKEMRRSAEELYQSAQTYHELALLQYVNGIISYIDVLDAQRQLFDAEIAVNDATLDALLATVSLYKVLGGGLNK